MPPLSIMIKPASSLCNLRCKYCFYCDVAAHRDVFSLGKMELSTAENLIKSALSFASGCSVAFAFQGGEPLIAGKEYFENFVSLVNRYNTKGSEIYYSIQTNGTLVDDEWARFFRDNRFLVGLSLDGDYEGNKFRVDANGQNSYYKITKAANKFIKHGVEFNILTVLTGHCAENAERIYKHFRSMGYRYLQFIPCLRPMGDSTQSELYMTADQYADFLIRIFNLYVKDFTKGNYMSVRQFDNWVRMYLGERPEQCGLCGYCTHQFVAEGNGNIYPCDFYCTDEWLLGNINETSLEEMAECERATRFIKESLTVDERCKNCRFFPICRQGGCKRNRESSDYCSSYMKFFSSCMPLFRLFTKR
ncbi:MAG: SPASM domain-containing protein [Ruminococcaceae bacterium]|nr:SPASM domain-containing protein [Oscillospiraceae bacterium]